MAAHDHAHRLRGVSLDEAARAGVVMKASCLALVAALVMLPAGASAQPGCAGEPLAVQVLGSGGPYAGDTRASTGYLVWQDGHARVMIDAGGGVFLRFGEAGAQLADLSLLGITHLHPDHVSDLPALLWLSEQARKAPLRISGPSGGGSFPAFDAFVSRLFDATSGAFQILGGTLGQAGPGVKLDVAVVDATAASPTTVLSAPGLEVTAVGVPHGNVPSVGYRVRVGDRSVVFGSDQTGTDPKFTAFASGADVLVLHLAVSSQAPAQVTALHATPARVGEMARDAKARRLVLSHFIKAPPVVPTPQWFSRADLDAAVADVRRSYSGPIDVASDLQCIAIR